MCFLRELNLSWEVLDMRNYAISLTVGVLGLASVFSSYGAGGVSTAVCEQEILRQAPNMSPKALDVSLRAYRHAVADGINKKPMLTVIDFSKPSNEKRLWIINMKTDRVVDKARVAHGKGSGMLYATNFSNTPGTDASSLGVYVTGNTYYGKHGRSLRLHGLENGINNNAYNRTIVLHSAWYVSNSFVKEHGRTGRSWGCPAVSQTQAPKIISTIKQGSIMVAYYPNSHWINTSQFLA